jgi:sigma-B regulation protein RsbU (phosphoserine phosphatase)
LRRGEREYLWFAAAELGGAAGIAWGDHLAFDPVWFQGWWTTVTFLGTASGICFLMFVVALLKQRRALIYWIALASILTSAVPVLAADLNMIGYSANWGVATFAEMPYWVCVPLLLFFAARRGNLDARLLLGPVALAYGVTIVHSSLGTLATAGFVGWEAYWRLDSLFTWPFRVSAQNIADFLMQISILAILVLRFARTRHDEERHAAELEAARTVQQVLVPEEIPGIPGFAIQSVYKPAGQVGGDFFQIIPVKSGGVLVAIGDVSGKGMPAAMTVSLLVGTLRTLAHYTQSPGEILAAMNQRMIARSHGGFTTCLVLRCDADGRLTIANAGHIAPYAGGRELPLENGLPLGLSPDTTYAERGFQLAPGDQLTLLTDGVVEARDKAGALFGFERSAALSTQPAEAIACAAQAFGQDDDITALTLSYAGVPASA